MGSVWVDGRIVAAQEARIPVDDRGFLFGDGAFETLRLHGGAPFRAPRHLARLEESLRLLGLRMPMPASAMMAAARALVETDRLSEGLLRITVTAGGIGDTSPGHVVMAARPLPALPSQGTLDIADALRRVPGPLCAVKTISRALESAALREASARGAFDAILLNTEGRVAETTARNLFAVKQGGLRTPSLAEGALPGVTRSAVLEVAKALGVPVREATLTVEELLASDEVFLTGSGAGVLGVARVGKVRLPSCPGPVTAALRTAYESLLERDARW